jgi:hypothetical protein
VARPRSQFSSPKTVKNEPLADSSKVFSLILFDHQADDIGVDLNNAFTDSPVMHRVAPLFVDNMGGNTSAGWTSFGSNTLHGF